MDPRAPAIVVDGVTKRFRRPQEQMHTLKERALHPLRRRAFDTFTAVDDVSFAVEQGEFFGIVGRNGSGKSTLLKLIAGIYRTDGGEIWVNGRTSTFIELGVGFNPGLAARDNVILNGIMLGLSPREARRRVDAVIDFAELHDFTDLKLKNYSSGMQVRLAFSVMIQVDADVLLIDEVLAVGDAAFQQKCFDVFHRMKDAGKTIVFVTHDMAAVKRFCDRAMLLDGGRVRMIGDPERVGDNYVEVNFGREVTHAAPLGEEDEQRYGDRTAEIADVWFEDDTGERTGVLRQGEPARFRALVRFNARAEHPGVAILFENDQHVPLFVTSIGRVREETGVFEAGDEAVLSVDFDCAFAPGRVHLSPWVAYRGGADLMDRRPRMASVLVTGTDAAGGLVDLPHDVELTVRSAEGSRPGAP